MEQHENHYLTLLDEARAEAAVASRERQRLLEQLQRESATLLGVLADLAEQRRPVAVRLDTGDTVTGTIDLIGRDVVAVGGTWVRLSSIGAVRATGSTGSRDDALVSDIDLDAVLARLAADRPRLVLLVAGGEPVRGELAAVGEDVLSLRLDGDGALVFVPLAAVSGVRPTS